MTDEHNKNSLESEGRRRFLQASAAGAALAAVPVPLQALSNAAPTLSAATTAATHSTASFNGATAVAKLIKATTQFDLNAFAIDSASYNLPKRTNPQLLTFSELSPVERFISSYTWFCRGLHASSSAKQLHAQSPELFKNGTLLQSDNFLLGIDPIYDNPRVRFIAETMIKLSYQHTNFEGDSLYEAFGENAKELLSHYRALKAPGVLPEAETFLQKIIASDVSIGELEQQASLYEARHILFEVLQQKQEVPPSLEQMEQAIKDYQLDSPEGFSPKKFQQRIKHYIDSPENEPESKPLGFDPACAPASLYQPEEAGLTTPHPEGRIKTPKQLAKN